MSLLRKLFVCSKTSQTGAGNSSGQTDKNTDIEKQTQSGTGSDAAEGAATETECAVCQDQLTDPCTVPCGNRHVFCLVCLKGLVSHGSHRTHFPCPLCRKRVRIPFGGVGAFRNNKSLGQKLRSKFPVLPSRSRHRRRRSRSGLRSTDYVTVSFPVLGYSEELQLDILSTLYAHQEGQSVNRERLMEAILEEIGGQRPNRSRPRNPVWLSNDLDYSDSDQEEEEARRQAVLRAPAPRPPSRGEPARADPEDLDMSVVLQIIADMEENERRRNVSEQAPQRPTAATGWGQSPRPDTNRAALQVSATTGPGRSQNLSRPERGQAAYAPQRLEMSNSTLHAGPDTTCSVSQRMSNTPLHGPDTTCTSQRPRPDHARSTRSDGSNTLPQASAEAHNSPSRKPDTGSAAPQGTPATAQKTEANQPAPQTSRLGNTPVKSQSRTATPERLCPETARPHRPEPLETSSRRSLHPHLASERSHVVQATFPDLRIPSARRGDSETTEETNPTSAKSQRSDRNPPPPTTRSSSPRKLSAETHAGDAVRDSCPVNSKSKAVPEGSDPDMKNDRFVPRPRMGSFKLAIAAGQRTPVLQEDESPPLFPLVHPEGPASPQAREAIRHNVHLSAQRDFQFCPTKNTKTEIQEPPVKFTRHQRHATDSAPSVVLKEKSEDQLVRMMDSADRDMEEERTPVMNSRRHVEEEEHRTRKMPTAAQDSASRNSCERLHQKGLRYPEHFGEGLGRPRNEAVTTSCPPDPSDLTLSYPESSPRAVQTRDDRMEHSEEEGSTLPLPLADGLQPKHRRLLETSSTPGWETPSSEDFQEKPRHVGISGQDFQEKLRHMTASGNDFQEKPKHVSISENDFQEKSRHGRISNDEFQEKAAHSTPPASSGKDSEDSEWTRRIRGLQRRVMSQAWSKESHSMGVAQGPALSPSTYTQTLNNRLTEGERGLDTKNDDVDAIEV